MKRLVWAAFACAGCAGDPGILDDDSLDGGPDTSASPFAVAVVLFEPGVGAGFGQDGLPGVVLGGPLGGGEGQGAVDGVLSLGRGGRIVLRLGRPIVEVNGPDLLVFENAFLYGTAESPRIFGEAGAVSVSDDGERFFAFPCDASRRDKGGCAGFAPVLAGDNGVDATDPDVAGGDRFDLADLELPADVGALEYVQIVDVSESGGAPNAGFDLDAVAVVGAAD